MMHHGHTWAYINFQSFYGAPQLSDYEVYQPGLIKGFCSLSMRKAIIGAQLFEVS